MKAANFHLVETRRIRIAAIKPRCGANVLALPLFVSLVVAAPVNHAAALQPSVRANDPAIQYTGRIDHNDPIAPTLWWPSSEIAARFEATSISVRLEDYGDNYFYAIIDGGTPMLLDLEPGIATYKLADNLSDAAHTIRLVKRTETAEGRAAFHGFIFERGGGLIDPPERPQRRIEFYGDSITAGHSVASTSGDSNRAEHKDSYNAYAAVAARDLGAEHHCIAVSAIGLFVDAWGFGGTMQSLYYDRLGPSRRWDFTQWEPQLVVVNLGQNDAWGPHTSSEARDNYVRFARTLRGHYPDAHIVLALGCMQATDDDSEWPGYVRAAVETLRNEDADRRVHGFIFPYSGDAHPSAIRQRAMADQLVAFVRAEIPGFH